MKKTAIFIYGVISYTISVVVIFYAMGFIGNIWVSQSLDAKPMIPFIQALMINLGLLSLIALQHSTMARKSFKKKLIQWFPESTERATYNLMTSTVMIVTFYFWQPMGGVIWQIEQESFSHLILLSYLFGWVLISVSTFWIDHLHLFGLKQVWFQLKDQNLPKPKYPTPSLYQRVRHPLNMGWIIVFWATPVMTVAHLVFALLGSAYILLAHLFVARDLELGFGEKHSAYTQQVPMNIPSLRAKKLSSNHFTVIKRGASS